MDSDLLRLMEELLDSMDARDSGDPDAPGWEASIRIRELEDELTRRLGAIPAGADPRSMVLGEELLATG